MISMTFFVQSHFNWPRRWGMMGEWLQDVILTDAGAAHFNEQLGCTCLAMGQTLGFIRPTGEGNSTVDVFHHSGSFMGTTDNKLKAAEELVRIYARQADSLNR